MYLLQVGRNIYTGDAVSDGFFEALQNLKIPAYSPSDTNSDFPNSIESYHHILQTAKSGPPIPALSLLEVKALLKRLRPDVLDLYSISARHYLAAGTQGLKHFSALLNLFISNVNLTSVKELNSA